MSNPYTTNLMLDLDPSTLALSDGATVSSGLNDSSGNGSNVTTYQGTPKFKVNIFGTLPAIRFAGGIDGLGGAFSSWSSSTGMTTIIAAANFVSAASSGGFATISATSGNDTSNGSALIYDDGQSTASYINGDHGLCALPSGQAVLGYGTDATSYTQAINGGVVGKGTWAGALLANGRYSVAQRWVSGALTTTFGVAYDFGRMLVYKERLSDANFKAVTLWLAQLLGIVSGSSSSSNVILIDD